MAEAQPSVFLSYARADDEPFVERLHGDLIHAGIEDWWDRAAMESRGRTFLQEIRDAIEGVDRVIAVVGQRRFHRNTSVTSGTTPFSLPKASSRSSGWEPTSCFRPNYWGKMLRDWLR